MGETKDRRGSALGEACGSPRLDIVANRHRPPYYEP